MTAEPFMCKTDMRGLAKHHSLKFIATEQAAIFNELGVRTGCNIVMVNNFLTMNLNFSIKGKIYKACVKSYSL